MRTSLLGVLSIFKISVNSEAIDNMQYKKAVQLCDKVLKKQTDLQAGKALKALALSRLQRVDEATALIGQLVQERPVDEGTLQAMAMYFRETGQCELSCLHTHQVVPALKICRTICNWDQDFLVNKILLWSLDCTQCNPLIAGYFIMYIFA